MYSRLVHGARVSLIVGIGSTLLGSVLGGIIGLLSGYAGGKTDLIAQRLLDILQGLPLLVLALVMSAALGPSIHNVIIAISIPIVPRASRIIRASVLSIREMQYIEAARALGLRHVRIAFRHVLPNTIGPFIVLVTAQLGAAILVEAALSFLGLGVPEPYPSWGRMLSVSAAEYAQKAPHLVLFPASPSAWRSSGPICSATPCATRSTPGCEGPEPVRARGPARRRAHGDCSLVRSRRR